MAEILFKELSYTIVGAAMEVHRILGPGFLEAVYQAALAHELTLRGIRFEQLKRSEKVISRELTRRQQEMEAISQAGQRPAFSGRGSGRYS